MGPPTKSNVKDLTEELQDRPCGLRLSDFINKLVPFEGDEPEAFRKFHATFKDMITIFDIDSDELKFRILKQSLRGSALEWYAKFWSTMLAENEGEPLPFHEVEAALTKKYEPNDAPLVVWCRIADTYHGGDITKYNEMFGRVVTETGSKFTSVEQLLTLEYIRGLESEFAQAVSQKNPSSWREAAQFAALHACLQSRSQYKDRKRPPPVGQGSMEKLCIKKYRANGREHGVGTAKEHNRSFRTRNNRCYICQRVGHWAKDCRDVKKQRP